MNSMQRDVPIAVAVQHVEDLGQLELLRLLHKELTLFAGDLGLVLFHLPTDLQVFRQFLFVLLNSFVMLVKFIVDRLPAGDLVGHVLVFVGIVGRATILDGPAVFVSKVCLLVFD